MTPRRTAYRTISAALWTSIFSMMCARCVSTVLGLMNSSAAMSIEELERLIAVIDAPDRWWDARLASDEVGMSEPVARAALHRFGSSNLLDIRVTDDVRYRFRPGTPALRDGAAAFAAAYRSHAVAIVQLLGRSAQRTVRDFADAFRFRRHEPR